VYVAEPGGSESFSGSLGGFEVRPDTLRGLAGELARLRGMLEDALRLSRQAALFAAPGQDPVSTQLAPPLRDAADDGPGSLSHELTLGLKVLQRHIDALLAMGRAYDDAEEAIAREFRKGPEA
jgi:hypothetical protein